MKNAIVLGLVALALVACGKKEEVKVEPVVEAAPAVAPAPAAEANGAGAQPAAAPAEAAKVEAVK
jgi:hypothetical protein